MQRAARNANQVAGLNFDSDNGRSLGIHMKEAAALDDETDLVFIMPVLAAEFREHRVKIWSLGIDVDHVRCHISAGCFEFLDLGKVRIEDVLLGSFGG